MCQLSVAENEACLLIENAEENNLKWKVRNSAGTEGFLPAIIFLIPPPDRDIVHHARRYATLGCSDQFILLCDCSLLSDSFEHHAGVIDRCQEQLLAVWTSTLSLVVCVCVIYNRAGVIDRCQEQLLAVWTSTLSLVKQRVYNYFDGALSGADATPLCVLNPEQRLEVNECLEVMTSLLVPSAEQSTNKLCQAAQKWKTDLNKMKGTAKGLFDYQRSSLNIRALCA